MLVFGISVINHRDSIQTIRTLKDQVINPNLYLLWVNINFVTYGIMLVHEMVAIKAMNRSNYYTFRCIELFQIVVHSAFGVWGIILFESTEFKSLAKINEDVESLTRICRAMAWFRMIDILFCGFILAWILIFVSCAICCYCGDVDLLFAQARQ